MSLVDPSVKVPTAANCCLRPAATDGLVGVTLIETTVAAETVSKVLPVFPPKAAKMVVEPSATLEAIPLLPAALLIVALLTSEEAQVACMVRSAVVLSENVPVAMNCCVRPSGKDGFGGVSAIETKVLLVTVSAVDPVTPFKVAVMLTGEALVASPLARPLEPLALLMLAMTALEVAQVTCEVTSEVVESDKLAIAVYCCITPAAIDTLAGVTVMLCTAALVTDSPRVPFFPLKAAVMMVEPALIPVARPLLPAALLIVATVSTELVQVAVAVMSEVF